MREIKTGKASNQVISDRGNGSREERIPYEQRNEVEHCENNFVK
jgi:hypothetical protein